MEQPCNADSGGYLKKKTFNQITNQQQSDFIMLWLAQLVAAYQHFCVSWQSAATKQQC